MSFEPDSIDQELYEKDLLIKILLELRKLNIIMQEVSGLRVSDRDIEDDAL